MARSLLAAAAHCTLHSGIYYIISYIYLNKVNYVRHKKRKLKVCHLLWEFNSLYTVCLIEFEHHVEPNNTLLSSALLSSALLTPHSIEQRRHRNFNLTLLCEFFSILLCFLIFVHIHPILLAQLFRFLLQFKYCAPFGSIEAFIQFIPPLITQL